MAVKHIVTKTGFELDIEDSCLDDMELFDAVVDLQAGNMMAVPTVVSKICGSSKKALYDHTMDKLTLAEKLFVFLLKHRMYFGIYMAVKIYFK